MHHLLPSYVSSSGARRSGSPVAAFAAPVPAITPPWLGWFWTPPASWSTAACILAATASGVSSGPTSTTTRPNLAGAASSMATVRSAWRKK